ncbi:helix-turn-helix domain-containing protein [Niallia circulans]|uniref:helix-turn-helix domain-containing protein n=1 Tax=Niallia circulans TaxID=1397 RepID=UPI00156132CA|nr:helix-turn-helix transcriptional regulator [Niallia circulans]NRG35183.1 helix-turn-helix domain-containing protein [Niallia circulans]
MSEFGAYIKKIRESKDLTLNQVALYSEISAAQLSRIETGKRGVPKPATIKKIADALKYDYEELMAVAGYIKNEEKALVAGTEITLSQEEYKIFEELKKHPILFHDLAKDPEKKIKELIRLQKARDMFLKEDDDEKKGYGFGELDDE